MFLIHYGEEIHLWNFKARILWKYVSYNTLMFNEVADESVIIPLILGKAEFTPRESARETDSVSYWK